MNFESLRSTAFKNRWMLAILFAASFALVFMSLYSKAGVYLSCAKITGTLSMLAEEGTAFELQRQLDGIVEAVRHPATVKAVSRRLMSNAGGGDAPAGYDEESLRGKLRVFRTAGTVSVEFESENPRLSEFAANAFSEEGLARFNREAEKKHKKRVSLLKKILRKKSDEMNAQIEKVAGHPPRFEDNLAGQTLGLLWYNALIGSIAQEYMERKGQLAVTHAAYDTAASISIAQQAGPGRGLPGNRLLLLVPAAFLGLFLCFLAVVFLGLVEMRASETGGKV